MVRQNHIIKIKDFCFCPVVTGLLDLGLWFLSSSDIGSFFVIGHTCVHSFLLCDVQLWWRHGSNQSTLKFLVANNEPCSPCNFTRNFMTSLS